MSETADYGQWVALREYLGAARVELRDSQVRQWVRQWTEQIDNRLTISGQSYRVCSTCNRGGHHCPGCGADVRHGEIACDECSDRAPRTRDEVLDEELAKVEISTEPGANPVGKLIEVNERVEKRMERLKANMPHVTSRLIMPGADGDETCEAKRYQIPRGVRQVEVPVSQLVSGDSVYSPSTKTWHEVRRSVAGQLYFRRDERWMPVGFAADVKFLTRRGDSGAAAGALFDALGGEVIEG